MAAPGINVTLHNLLGVLFGSIMGGAQGLSSYIWKWSRNKKCRILWFFFFGVAAFIATYGTIVIFFDDIAP